MLDRQAFATARAWSSGGPPEERSHNYERLPAPALYLCSREKPATNGRALSEVRRARRAFIENYSDGSLLAVHLASDAFRGLRVICKDRARRNPEFLGDRSPRSPGVIGRDYLTSGGRFMPGRRRRFLTVSGPEIPDVFGVASSPRARLEATRRSSRSALCNSSS